MKLSTKMRKYVTKQIYDMKGVALFITLVIGLIINDAINRHKKVKIATILLCLFKYDCN